MPTKAWRNTFGLMHPRLVIHPRGEQCGRDRIIDTVLSRSMYWNVGAVPDIATQQIWDTKPKSGDTIPGVPSKGQGYVVYDRLVRAPHPTCQGRRGLCSLL